MKGAVKPSGLFDENGEREKAAGAPLLQKKEEGSSLSMKKEVEEEIPFSEQFGI